MAPCVVGTIYHYYRIESREGERGMKTSNVLSALILAILYLAAYWRPTVGLVAGWALLALVFLALLVGGNNGGQEDEG
jgi:uncharacterized membrane protein YkgB